MFQKRAASQGVVGGGRKGGGLRQGAQGGDGGGGGEARGPRGRGGDGDGGGGGLGSWGCHHLPNGKWSSAPGKSPRYVEKNVMAISSHIGPGCEGAGAGDAHH